MRVRSILLSLALLLPAVPGIGKRSAQKLILELRPKFDLPDASDHDRVYEIERRTHQILQEDRNRDGKQVTVERSVGIDGFHWAVTEAGPCLDPGIIPRTVW